jgi:hypothetical protein
MRHPLPPVRKAYRPPVRDRSYVDSASELERQFQAALERTKNRLAEQREEVARREKVRH